MLMAEPQVIRTAHQSSIQRPRDRHIGKLRNSNGGPPMGPRRELRLSP